MVAHPHYGGQSTLPIKIFMLLENTLADQKKKKTLQIKNKNKKN